MMGMVTVMAMISVMGMIPVMMGMRGKGSAMISVMGMVTMMMGMGRKGSAVISVMMGEANLAQSVNSTEEFIIVLKHVSVQFFEMSSVA